VVRANESRYAADAVILAAQRAEGPWISAAETTRIDGELNRIRAKYPVLDLIHARGPYVLTDLLVTVRHGSDWAKPWLQGNLRTGNAKVDAFFQSYNLATVEGRDDVLPNPWFVLHFAQSLRTDKLIEDVKSLSGDILNVDPNGYGGDGDEITLTERNGARIYAFSHGWGDCPSGCIQRHLWTVTVEATGTISMVESGNPLDPSEFPPSRAAKAVSPMTVQ
jgi:hypothetical protein